MRHKSSNIGKDCNSPCNTHYIPLYVFIALLCRILSTLAYHSLTSSVASAELSWHGRCVPEPTASAPPRVRLLRAAAWIEEPAGHLTRNPIKFGEFRLGKVFCRKLDTWSVSMYQDFDASILLLLRRFAIMVKRDPGNKNLLCLISC